MRRGLGSETLLRWHHSPVRPWVAIATLVTGKLQTFSRWGSYLHAATISAASLRRGHKHRVPLRRTCCTPSRVPLFSLVVGSLPPLAMTPVTLASGSLVYWTYIRAVAPAPAPPQEEEEEARE